MVPEDESHPVAHPLDRAYDVTGDGEAAARARAEALYEEALRTVRAREDLLAFVSHDLRNPLSTILMSAHQVARLADGAEAERTKKAAATIVKAVARMNRLIGDLLDMATLDAGKPLPLERKPQDVVVVIREADELFEPVASGRQLTLTTELPPPTEVDCDSARIEQVVSNLIGNAVKFTRAGGRIQVGARLSGNEIVVSVSDTGVGIPTDHLPHIFKPYWQADAEMKRGAGLGLSIAKAIVETHGGRIWVQAGPAGRELEGTGTTFYFSLPVALPSTVVEE